MRRFEALLLFAMLLGLSAPVHSGPAIQAGDEPLAVRAAASDPALTAASAPTAHPDRVVRLVFIHHSTGEAWLADGHGRLGSTLAQNRYFVSDTNYGWGPAYIGDLTDIGHWWTWFRGPGRNSYMNALYTESDQHCGYSRLPSTADPGGPNQIVMFKSCFPNSALKGHPADPVPGISSNPLRGQDSGSPYHTVANAKGIYIDLLKYFAKHRDKLFIAVAAPPLSDPEWSSNARAFNQWLYNDWLRDYQYRNVAVFDFYNVLTTNGGSPAINDLGRETGNHHRWLRGAIQHKTDGDGDANPNVLEYPTGDDHPSRAGDRKATAEFIKLLNFYYNRWRPPLGEALDNGDLVWTSGGGAKWFGQTADFNAGGGAARSGAVSNGRTSWLATTVTGPGTLSFYWKVSSEANHDFLQFSIDGNRKNRISGNAAWARKTYSLGPGTHSLQWKYLKDGVGSSGEDAGFVDGVVWTTP